MQVATPTAAPIANPKIVPPAASPANAVFGPVSDPDIRRVFERQGSPESVTADERQAATSAIEGVQKMFSSLGVKGYEGNGPGMKVIFDSSFPNAAYVPQMDTMIIGRAETGKSFAFATDVIAHEYTHRVANSIVRIEPNGEPGAVNESLADTFAAAFDTDDWMLAEDIVPGGVRDLRNPEREQDAVSLDGGPPKPLPGHMKDYMKVHPDVDQGGVHLNVGIPNKAAALIGEALGRQTMAQLYIDAMRKMGPRSDIAMTARATMQAATARFGAGSKETDAVLKAWDAVGIIATA